jgi:ATP-dependent Zn proteases
MMILAFNMFGSKQLVDNKVPFTEFINMVNEKNIKEATIRGEELIAVTEDGKKVETIVPSGYSRLYDILSENGVQIKVLPSESSNWFLTLLVSWLPILLFIGLWIFMMSRCPVVQIGHFHLQK